MNKYLLRKRIFAVVFLGTVFGFAGVNLVHSYEPLSQALAAEDVTPEKLEDVITENLECRMNFIETYSYIQLLMNKRESNNFDYIKDEEGFMHYASFYQEDDERLFEYAMRIKRLQDYVGENGTQVLFVVPPAKYDKTRTEFRPGLSANDSTYLVDGMLLYLNRLGVETLDMRESLPNEELTYEDAFFKTDHHWTIPAAFYATQVLIDKMKECFGVDLDPEGFYMDIDNYEVVTYPSNMLGSIGRSTGANFGGVEDFTALWPKFPGYFIRESMRDDGERVILEGSFADALLDTDVLLNNPNIYLDSLYSLYLDGLRVYEKIENEDNPDGCRIFFVRDSYFSPVMAFMAPMCGEIDAFWSQEDTQELDVKAYLTENTFDYVIIEVYPYNISSNSFNFFKEVSR